MGKSIRSKRKKRLRTLKREIAQPLYDSKDALKQAAMESALQAPKVEIPTKKSQIGFDQEYEGRSGGAAPMSIDEEPTETVKRLKAKGGIKKRGKSKARLKKEKRRQKKLNF